MTMTQFKISQLRSKNMQTMLEVIGVLLLSVFVTVLLPQLLFRYLYADAQLTAEPPLLEMIPTVAFGIGLIFTLYGFVISFMRERQISALTKEMEDQALSLKNPMVTEQELAELENLVEKALDSEKKSSKSKSGKKTSRSAKSKSKKA